WAEIRQRLRRIYLQSFWAEISQRLRRIYLQFHSEALQMPAFPCGSVAYGLSCGDCGTVRTHQGSSPSYSQPREARSACRISRGRAQEIVGSPETLPAEILLRRARFAAF